MSEEKYSRERERESHCSWKKKAFYGSLAVESEKLCKWYSKKLEVMTLARYGA